MGAQDATRPLLGGISDAKAGAHSPEPPARDSDERHFGSVHEYHPSNQQSALAKLFLAGTHATQVTQEIVRHRHEGLCRSLVIATQEVCEQQRAAGLCAWLPLLAAGTEDDWQTLCLQLHCLAACDLADEERKAIKAQTGLGLQLRAEQKEFAQALAKSPQQHRLWEACRHKQAYVRSISISTLAVVSQDDAKLRAATLTRLLAMPSDADPAVRAATATAVGQLTASNTRQWQSALQYLLRCCQDDTPRVRKAAAEGLSCLASTASGGEVMAALTKACQEADRYARNAYEQVLCIFAENAPSDSLRQCLIQACTHAHLGPCSVVFVRALEVLVNASDRHANDPALAKLLQDACTKALHDPVRTAATAALAAAVQRAPQRAEAAIQTLASTYQDDSPAVRQAALEAAVAIGQALPATREAVCKVLRAACQDEFRSMSSYASSALAQLQPAKPHSRASSRSSYPDSLGGVDSRPATPIIMTRRPPRTARLPLPQPLLAGSVASADTRATASSALTTATYAPPAIAFLVGRDAVRKQLTEALLKAADTSVTYLLAGPGGMGKSQLALQLFRAAQNAPEQYDHVLWLPAESRAQLTEAYLELAGPLGVYVDKKQPTRHAIAQVRRQLAAQRCLYVFDAAPDLSVIQDFLPLQPGHVIITSRNGQQGAWPMETHILHLPGFDESAVVSLAAKFECALSAKDRATIAYLQREFSGHPAVLAQFFSFCQTQNLAPAAYIQELQHCPLDEREEELLQMLRTKPEGRVGYSKSALQMLRTSTEALAKEAAGKTALALMSRLAYLEPRSIPVDWLLTFVKGTQRKLSDQRRVRTALALLEKYSLVQWDRKTNEVHVQAVMQKLVRHLQPQASLQPLVQSLINYTSTEGDKKKRAAQWSTALLHGRRLFARLHPTRDLAVRQGLTAHLAKACKIGRLCAERCHWAQQHLAAVQQRYPEQNHAATAHALSELGVSLNQCGKYAAALKHKQAALTMYQAIAKSDDAAAQEQLARAHGEVGTTLSWLGRYQEALKCKQEALRIRQQLYEGKDHAEVAHALNSLGELCVHLKDYRQAQQYTRQALEMRKRLHQNQDHADVARSLTGMGTVLERLGKYEEALKHRREALDMDQRLSAKHSAVGLGHSLNHMGETLIRAGKPAAGVEYCTKALALRKKHFKQPDHPHIAYSLNSIGIGLAAQSNYAAGLKRSQKALAMLQRIYAADHPYMVAVLENIIACLTKLDEAAKSVPYQQRLETLKKTQT